MFTTSVVMPKRKGEEGTRMVRVHSDLADMIGWIVRLEGGTTAAQIIDPLVRPQVAARYEEIRPMVERIKKRRAAKKAQDESAD